MHVKHCSYWITLALNKRLCYNGTNFSTFVMLFGTFVMHLNQWIVPLSSHKTLQFLEITELLLSPEVLFTAVAILALCWWPPMCLKAAKRKINIKPRRNKGAFIIKSLLVKQKVLHCDMTLKLRWKWHFLSAYTAVLKVVGQSCENDFCLIQFSMDIGPKFSFQLWWIQNEEIILT